MTGLLLPMHSSEVSQLLQRFFPYGTLQMWVSANGDPNATYSVHELNQSPDSTSFSISNNWLPVTQCAHASRSLAHVAID